MDATTIHRRRYAILAVLCLSLFLIVVDNTITNVALPTLVRELHASNTQLAWVVDAYSLVFAGLLLAMGSLGDRYGRKGALTIGLIVFTTFSTVAAFTHSPAQLIAARAVMGAGAALIFPATLAILANVFTDPRERAKAIGIWAAVTGAAVALGPISGASCSSTSGGVRCSSSTSPSGCSPSSPVECSCQRRAIPVRLASTCAARRSRSPASPD